MSELPKKIVFVQHARGLGGSAVSLRYTIKKLPLDRYRSVVAMAKPTESMASFYGEEGIESFAFEGLPFFEHTTASHGSLRYPFVCSNLLSILLAWKKYHLRVMELVERMQPDLVYLNSVILLPVAHVLEKENIPFVIHVRESPIYGNLGLRYGWMKKMLRRNAARCIFLSHADRYAWTGGNDGAVVHNFVPLEDFEPESVERDKVLLGLGIDYRRPILLYMGGFSEIKGIFSILETLRLLRETHPNILCIMPGTKDLPTPPAHIRKVKKIARMAGYQSTPEKALSRIQEYKLEAHIHRMPFENRIASLMGASDLLVFPAIRPHFARPVVEAAAMGTPSVATDIRGMDETLLHGKTGLIVPKATAHHLANAIAKLLDDDQRRQEMSSHAVEFARENFSADTQIRKIETVLEAMLPAQPSTTP